MTRRLLELVGALAVLAIGCGDPEPVAGLETEETATSVLAETTTVASSTTTAALEATSTTTDTSNPAFQVVALGASNVMGWGVGEDARFDPEQAYPVVFARALGDHLDVEIRLQVHHPDPQRNDLRHFDIWLELLATDEQMRTDLKAADVVVVEIGWATILTECGWYWSDDCLVDTMAEMPARYDELLSGIKSLVADEALLMIIKQGLPEGVGGYLWERASWPEFRAESFDVWWEAIDTAATEHNAIVVDGVASMNGPDVDIDLFAVNGYWQADGIHFSPEGHRFVAKDLLAAFEVGSESVAVSGEAPCVDAMVVGDERGRYECEEMLDDERVSGSSIVLLSDVDFDAQPTVITGKWTLENDGGMWEGDWTGVIESDGFHYIEGVMVGSGGYEGLVYRATWEYYDLDDINATGTIEPAA